MTATNLHPADMMDRAAEAAALLKLLAHEGRLIVLCQLAGGERAAGDLIGPTGLSQSALSQHLAKLREQNLVVTRRAAQTIYYRLADDTARQLIEALTALYCTPKAEAPVRKRRQPVRSSAT